MSINLNALLIKFGLRHNKTCDENEERNHDRLAHFTCDASSFSSFFITKELLYLLYQCILWNQNIINYLSFMSTLNVSIA